PSPLRYPLSFFSCSTPPRALHSFPTRRSSDLFAHRQVERQLVLQVAIQLLPLEERLYPHPVVHDRLPQFTMCRQPDRSENYWMRSEEHTSELQSHLNLVCRLLLEKKKNNKNRS